MSKDSFAQSAAYLKQAVPLMIKYQIPTTPNNYHLWYNYVSGDMPELNSAIDQAVKLQGTCSLTTCERLYHQHLASQDEQQMEAMKLNLAAMANELGHSMQDALVDTGQFQAMLDKSFDRLSLIDDEGLSLEDTMGILRELVRESRDVRMSTMHFRSQLSSAEKEIKELKEALSETRKLATEDALTNLLNRRAFDLEMECLIRTRQPFSLILVDIDRFKSFNDEYGHLLGDQVLRIFGKRLREASKEGITAYRLGGEEFALLAPRRSLALTRQMAESLRRAIEKMSILDRKSGRRIDHITASFGVGEHQGQETGDALVERTDKLLYKAKELGRNRVMPLPS
ncbi:GGDEF domain-containing protein [Aeromonas encheleia]|jgi:diguanylate cyclase|uniref:diguanylate cyclase n=1 Tax=Aeromonas encheleia TaxID=73010 RepID=A0AAE9MI41_9GAMM|nr:MULTISPECIES: GGDEF domain-containing protein [Aeromonas]MBV7437398.1 GGDEF domain-containing protein [Aeromonas sp. sif2416]MBV7599283.1 GGDEF domain-containing protein [Aeromonas sp. sia0103]UNP88023.1 GGDEF domain-containing protein [Aeromonas encheleia]USV58180.1 GGDEF domain-containing protein [Aeromonas encheleia]VEG95150.1 GGDEF domain-containing protein [Aeromonas encheleia]